MARKKKQYTASFKRNAIKLAEEKEEKALLLKDSASIERTWNKFSIDPPMETRSTRV